MPASPKPNKVMKHWSQRVTQNKDKGLLCGFRSGLETTNANHLEAHGEPVEYETFVVPWVMPQSLRRYTADFRLRNGIIVETKGVFEATDRAKHLFIKAQYPRLDIRFVFSRAKAKISPTSKTTLAEWCNAHGFKFSEKLIPVDWLAEDGPPIKPEDVIKLGPEGYQEFLSLERAKRR